MALKAHTTKGFEFAAWLTRFRVSAGLSMGVQGRSPRKLSEFRDFRPLESTTKLLRIIILIMHPCISAWALYFGMPVFVTVTKITGLYMESGSFCHPYVKALLLPPLPPTIIPVIWTQVKSGGNRSALRVPLI